MANNSKVGEDSTQVLIGAGLLVATAVIFVFCIILVGFATLREDQAFWTNAGGFPILPRDFVRWTFLPLFIVTATALLALNMACFTKLCGSPRFIIVESLFLLLCWGLLGISGYIAFKNNIQNIINGAPLHRHEEFKTDH